MHKIKKLRDRMNHHQWKKRINKGLERKLAPKLDRRIPFDVPKIEFYPSDLTMGQLIK